MKRTVQRRLAWWFVLISLFLFPSLGNSVSSRQQQSDTSEAPIPTDVGMIALIASPEKYDGKIIRTHGFLCIEFEGDAVYVHEEDYRHGLTKNSFALRLSKAQREQFKHLSLKYVLIEGTVYAAGLEHSDRWSGAIGNITRLEAWPIDRGRVSH